MTVVAAVKLSGHPVVIGDVVINHERVRVGHVSKVYRFGANVALGWSGPVRAARDTIRTLTERLRGPRIEHAELQSALRALPGQPGLELTGWLIDGGSHHFHWCGDLPGVVLLPNETFIGDGSGSFRRLLEHRSEGSVTGIYQTVCEAMLNVADARMQELLYRDLWPTTWGAAYDIAFYAEGTFMWAPTMTCLAWDCHMNSRGEVTSIDRHPTMVKQLRVHERLVVQIKKDGEPECTTEVCEPVHEMMKGHFAESTPFSPRAFCYANYVRLFVEGRYVNKMAFVVVKPGADGPLVVKDDPVDGARFEIDVEEIGQKFRDSFPTAFGRAVASAESPASIHVPFLKGQPTVSEAPVGVSPAKAEVGSWNRKLRIDTVLALVRDNAASDLAGADALFGRQPYVFVVGDASEPLGETFLVSAMASKEGNFDETRARIRAQVAARHAYDGNLAFGIPLTTKDTVNILQRSASPEQIAVAVELTARFTTLPPPGHAHVLGIAEGGVHATLVPLPGAAPFGLSLPALNVADHVVLEMTADTKNLALDVAAEAISKGERLEDGIAVLIDLRQPGGLEFMVALTPEAATDPDGVRARLQAQAAGSGAAVTWVGVHEVVAVLRHAGLDDGACARVLGPSPPGEFRIALVGAQTVVTTMSLAA